MIKLWKTLNQCCLCIFLCIICICCPLTSFTQSTDQAYYQYSSPFEASETKLFRGALVEATSIYVDSSQYLSIEDIILKNYEMSWQSPDQIRPSRDANYWIKTKMIANQSFKGRHVFHIGESLGNDLHTFDYITTYAFSGNGQQMQYQVGRLVPLDKRPIRFWANLLPIDLTLGDTITVYLKLEGLNLSYPPESIHLWHVDMKDAFSTQIYLATKSALFYGILGIQILFFLFLFLIEREKIYVYFSVFGLGLFLTRAFSEFNFSSFVPLPSLAIHNEIIFHSSVYLGILGGILFVSKYLEIPSDSQFIRRFVPIYLMVTLISYLRFLFRYSFSESGSYPVLLTPAFYTLFALVLGIYMILTSPLSDKKSKLLLLLSIIPIIIGSIMTILYNEGLLPDFINALHVDDVMKIAVILLVVTLSLTVGYRSKSLKEEKNAAIQENLKAKQTIFEKQLRAEKLEEMDDLKTKLYTNITHEFRTPLTVIMGINDELTDSTKQLSLPADKKEKFLQNQQIIYRNSENLLTLVNQLLDLSKSDGQQLELRLIQDDIISYLNYLTESFFSKAKEKNVRLVFYSELSSLIMDYDEQKIQHVAYNLLSNAIKFTPENGKIVMHAAQTEREDQSCLQLVVKDNGIGIASDHLPHIFDRFYQVDDSHTRHVDGSGIGLSLTKEMVRLMKGTIIVESQLAVGTTFTIHIPITNQAKRAPSQSSIRLTQRHHEASFESSDLATETINPADEKPILLIAEDNRDVFSYLKMVLGQTYQIIEAINGEQGITKALKYVPDLIISDVMMPIKDGYELTSVLKEDTRTSHIPIILLTAKASEIDRLAGLKIGADAYLSKPFNKEELLIRIDQLLEVRNRLRNHYSTLNASVNERHVTAAEKTESPQPESAKTHVREEEFLQYLQKIILKNIKNENLSADYLAQESGISQSQLYRKIKALTGLSINNYISKFRLQKSLELLQNTEKDIAEIAYEVGFSSPSYYSRSFHKFYKKSPLSVKKSLAKNTSDQANS